LDCVREDDDSLAGVVVLWVGLTDGRGERRSQEGQQGDEAHSYLEFLKLAACRMTVLEQES
jgi:hypothetical protein